MAKKIFLQTSIAGERFSYAPGDIIEVPDHEHPRFIEAGHGREPTAGELAVHEEKQAALKAEQEKAAKPAGKKPGKGKPAKAAAVETPEAKTEAEERRDESAGTQPDAAAIAAAKASGK